MKRIVLLSGKFYYDLVNERKRRGLEGDVALVRIEELSPFPFEELEQILRSYPALGEVYFVQEEPRNQGAFSHVQSRINSVLKDLGDLEVVYKGRKESAVPAPGIGKVYQAQQQAILSSVFEGM